MRVWAIANQTIAQKFLLAPPPKSTAQKRTKTENLILNKLSRISPKMI